MWPNTATFTDTNCFLKLTNLHDMWHNHLFTRGPWVTFATLTIGLGKTHKPANFPAKMWLNVSTIGLTILPYQLLLHRYHGGIPAMEQLTLAHWISRLSTPFCKLPKLFILDIPSESKSLCRWPCQLTFSIQHNLVYWIACSFRIKQHAQGWRLLL